MKQNPVDIYQEYLAWFKTLAQTPEGIAELRDRKAYAEWANPEAAVTPYGFGLWFLNDRNSGIDEEKLYKMMKRNLTRNRYAIDEATKHVGGNISAPLLDPEYVARARATKRLRDQYKTYSGSDEIAKDVLYDLRRAHGDLLKVVPTISGPPTVSLHKPPGLFKRLWAWMVKSPTPEKTGWREYEASQNPEFKQNLEEYRK
jgi:hypothetical protein